MSLTAPLDVTAVQTAVAAIIVFPAATAADHVLKKVEPEYPALARKARVQGTVVLKAIISPEGDVANLTAVSGHPMLITPAMDAVKQWQYVPFIVNGQARTVSTTVEVTFSLEIAAADYEKQRLAARVYFSQQEKCRELVNQAAYPEAEENCKPLIEMAEKLPAEKRIERIVAYQYTGHALFGQKKVAEALEFYQRELAVAQAALKPTDAELAYAYRDVARGFRETGDMLRARSSYEAAESTLLLAQEHMRSAFLRNEYAKTMKSLLRDHALLLRQSGDEAGAEALDKKAQSISIETKLTDN
jgi:TonB family protein